MRIYVLPGDGIGPEIAEAAVMVLQAANRGFDLGLSFDFDDIGFASLEKYGTTLRDETIEKSKSYDAILLGPISHLDYPPRDKGGPNPSAQFRVKLDLYANVRPARSRPFLNSVAKSMDLVIMREATEGFYPDRNMYKGIGEFMPTPDVALSVRKLTARGCERIARAAFVLAMKRRKKVTAIHKVNNFIISDGLFLDQVRSVAAEFPEVELNEVIIDAMAAHLVRDSSRYDVIVATNFHADILSDLASELSGGLGLAGSINANAETGKICAQAQHGSAPDIQGQNIANPTSLILSAAMMLSWLGEQRKLPVFEAAGAAMQEAVDIVLADPATRTRDLGGTLNTDEFGRAVAEAVCMRRASAA
ncbi:isocitrate/isopropylmalate dehydrogenase family protein [Rhodoplanes serenus]|uniref:Isocitrate/isopropylmalate dehydrogenase family protein n=1 Tax=Rhodoplanes serenus TaxID=200615 RepID=A0A327KDE5_9BRAD|nr:isocitrate/isopropylmalate dehydrogenase family protein [Rhodoplanes serenus]MTW19168.1 isocitrate/isopropylmalate dehydrogenase family protein [Rhodoplanes serenus]RAI35703.1 3-isopropylmalate dehydrogenase [Rhodoplanes serenus]